MSPLKPTLAISTLMIAALALTACDNDLSEGDKREILGGSTPSSGDVTGHDHSGHDTTPPASGDLNPAADTGKTGVQSNPDGVGLPADYQGCAWYWDVAHTTVCVPDPLPKEVTGEKACDYLQEQGYGPLLVLKGKNKSKDSDDPLKLDDNGDGVGCFSGDFGTADAPPDASGGGIVSLGVK